MTSGRLVARRDPHRLRRGIEQRREPRRLLHERRWQQPDQAHRRSGGRLGRRLVAGRHEDRVHELPQLVLAGRQRRRLRASAAGSGETNLTNSPDVDDGEPSWSPDGQKIAFPTERVQGQNLTYEIYVMNADGGNQVNLTGAASAMDESPAWSPDGSRIAFGDGPGRRQWRHLRHERRREASPST